MICPACGEVLTVGQERCSFCDAVVSPPTEGSLAPQPSAVTPPPRAREEPLRDLPGVRPRERTWKDEVSERVRHRRHKRAGLPELPLFERAEEPKAPRPPAAERRPVPAELERADALDAEAVDLPLRPAVAPPSFEDVLLEVPAELRREVARPEEGPLLEPTARPLEIKPVERPALFGERLRAAAVDLLLLGSMWAVVLYFTGRAARVSLLGLRPSWLFLAGYLAFLGLAYAAYFTGTTGQTPGKMATGLRVVDTSGQPPGYPRALARALLGAASTLFVGLGLLPMVFDPARRALHDRLFRTRVVRG